MEITIGYTIEGRSACSSNRQIISWRRLPERNLGGPVEKAKPKPRRGLFIAMLCNGEALQGVDSTRFYQVVVVRDVRTEAHEEGWYDSVLKIF